jgi:hypothetical protein
MQTTCYSPACKIIGRFFSVCLGLSPKLEHDDRDYKKPPLDDDRRRRVILPEGQSRVGSNFVNCPRNHGRRDVSRTKSRCLSEYRSLSSAQRAYAEKGNIRIRTDLRVRRGSSSALARCTHNEEPFDRLLSAEEDAGRGV